eukprot:TRINITY_DN61169_c0_g1_i1.p1 TRINITY_DN61169_c0_g1~~TRINITY_DN61169_c0_g1_i1.p1  ORF type:complete len:526 (+),score=111.02 TRINITY_DN61169_c0_g1_i1:103-1680(+)
MPRMAGSSAVPAGPHAFVRAMPTGNCEFEVTVEVPFELRSISEASLDISMDVLRLQGPGGTSETVEAPMPRGFRLDPERAVARYSRKKRQLTVVSPNEAAKLVPTPPPISAPSSQASAASPTGTPVVSPSQSAPTFNLTQNAASVTSAVAGASASHSVSATPARATGFSGGQGTEELKNTTEKVKEKDDEDKNEEAGEEDEDDDDLPPLEAARSRPAAPLQRNSAVEDKVVEAESSEGGYHETNEAAEALMGKALAARERKKKETEESRRKADLTGSGCLKKGFLSGGGGKSKKRSDCDRNGGEPPSGSTTPAKDVPYIAGVANPEEARQQGLRFPEVQAAVRQNINKLKEDNSWVTPQLMQAMQSRPDLLRGLSNPRIMEAVGLMQTDPLEAQRRYSSDPEVTKFLNEFSGLMATHFDVLSKEAPASQSKNVGATSSQLAPSTLPQNLKGASGQPAVASSGGSEAIVLDDPRIQEAFADPEVQQLIAELRAGRQLEIRELGSANPRLMHRIKVLLDAGLLSMQQ